MFQDSAPAVDMKTMRKANGKELSLPFGLLVLVVNASKVKDSMRTTQHKLANLVSDNGEYPPIVCVIAGTNRIEGVHVEDLKTHMRDVFG